MYNFNGFYFHIIITVTRPGLCPIAKETAEAAPTLCTEYGPDGWMDALWKILGLRGVSPKLINLMSELCSGTESAVRCGDTISNLCQLLLVFVGVCTDPHTFQHLYGLDFVEDVGEIKLRCIIWECQDL